MVKVRFGCRDMVKTNVLDSNVFPESTKYVDLGTHQTQQNQDMLFFTLKLFQIVMSFIQPLNTKEDILKNDGCH